MEYSTLSETLGCPVCHEISIPPIYQCPKGHLICKDCLPQLKARDCPECPICRTPLPQEDIRSLSTEQLAESLDVKCKNASEGCLTISKVGDVDGHLTVCQFEEDAWCQKKGVDPTCREKYFLKDFPTHCLNHNPHRKFYYQVPSEGLNHQCDFEFTTSEPEQRAQLTETETLAWPPLFFEAQGNIYIVTSLICKKEEKLTFKVFLRRGDNTDATPTSATVPITVKSTFSTVTWNVNSSNGMAEAQGEEFFDPLGTFSVPLKVLFPSSKGSELLRWNLILEFSA